MAVQRIAAGPMSATLAPEAMPLGEDLARKCRARQRCGLLCAPGPERETWADLEAYSNAAIRVLAFFFRV